jgi:hypothetical protein
MLLELYKLMIETAEKISLPEYAEFTIGIGKEESKLFWSEERFKKDRKIIMDEFEYVGQNRYTKIIYGIRFAIQFTNTKEQ